MDSLDYRIVKIIELGLVGAVTEREQWLVQVAVSVNCSVAELEDRLRKYQNRDPLWSNELGRIVFFR